MRLQGVESITGSGMGTVIAQSGEREYVRSQ